MFFKFLNICLLVYYYLLDTLRRLKLLIGRRSADVPLVPSDFPVDDESLTTVADSLISITHINLEILYYYAILMIDRKNEEKMDKL